MPTPQIEQYENQIRNNLPAHATPEAAAQAVRRFVESITAFNPDMERDLEAALQRVKASLKEVEILRKSSIVSLREPWYFGPRPGDQHWPALRGFFKNAKGWDEDTVVSIDASSSEIVSLLANPMDSQFRCRGLVVGYVQSGKTANMTAVIAKAVDSGYNLIVLLGGLTNKLRAQTQGRLDSDIVSRHRHLWQLYTTAEDDGDFNHPPNRSFTMPVKDRAQLVVMKKITSRLAAFRKTIAASPPAILSKLKVLILDDECDQASVNSSNQDFDMTRINEEIRKIVTTLPAVSYVGYTATPFANVFIDPFPHNKDVLDDLYPADFITALPRPDGYFGAREVFGSEPLDAGEESEQEAGRHMIRRISEAEVAILRPARLSEKDGFTPQMTDSLVEALLWYLATCAIRRQRGQVADHMTMLVHTSPYVIQHARMAELITSWLSAHAQDLRASRGPVTDRLAGVIETELRNVPGPSTDGERPTAESIRPSLRDVVSELEVVIENGVSVDRLDYTGEPKTYVVVGGSVLARGLTLEGLAVSYFLRTSKQYDTLLQMGRWFGFRPGYEDLPRLWTTSDLEGKFRSLARIEEEIREDIEVYRDKGATPLEFAVKVRSIPGMAITAASKMKSAYRTSISFEGRHVQTIRFDHQDSEVVGRNWAAAAQLVASASEFRKAESRQEHPLFQDVPFETIRRFLVGYDISEEHMDLKKDLLLGYLDKAQDDLPTWNVGVITPKSGPISLNPLGPLGKLPTNTRSQLTPVTTGYADIKALMSKGDILIDAPEAGPAAAGDKWEHLKSLRPQVPLLLLYPIHHSSQPKRGSTYRVALDAEGDLVGVGLVFPGVRDRSGGYFGVELDPPTPEELDEVDPTELESQGSETQSE